MVSRLPDLIDPVRLAEQGGALQGQIPLSRMPRLREAIASDEGVVEVALEFGVDEFGVRYLVGRVEAALRLVCQRCLEPMDVHITAQPSLGVVRTDHEAERLPPSYEPLQIGDEPVPLVAVVEDELLLALPIVPMHEPPVCAVQSPVAQDDDGDNAAKVSAFDVLRALKRTES
jgi:uncharacterized protein